MDNELITERSWWKRNWKWFLPLSAMIVFGIGIFLISSVTNILVKEERQQSIAFDREKWQDKDEFDYVYRNKMIMDLIDSETLKKLNEKEIIDLLGQPERIDSAYLFYRVSQEKIGFFPLHTTTLVVKLSGDDGENKVMIHE